MKIVVAIIIFLHGLIHLIGFALGFRLAEFNGILPPNSKFTGTLWLEAAILIMLSGVFYLLQSKHFWILGFTAVALSQILIVLFWHDAKFGTLPNFLILLVTITSFGNYQFQKLAKAETRFILEQCDFLVKKIITDDDIKHLPQPVKTWLVHSGVVGKPDIRAGKIVQEAEIKMKPGQQKWMHATAIQYTNVEQPAFIWVANVKVNNFLFFKGRDKFLDGKGEMLIKLNAVLKVVDEKGEKINEGTIQRFLGEMVWFPSLALNEYINWEQIDDTTAKATVNYKGTTGSGTFCFNTEGDFIKFSALRFMGNEAEAKRFEWVLEVQDYNVFEGIKVPSEMTATWKLDTGNWTWLKLKIADIQYNENTTL